MRVRAPQTYREFARAGALALGMPTLLFACLALLSFRMGDALFGSLVIALWALAILIGHVAVIYRVESLRRQRR